MSEETRSYTELVRALDSYYADTRAAAAASLRVYGAAAVEPLCQALQDKDAGVRAAATESLGLIGDARAVEPLCGALKGCMGGHSARRYSRRGMALLGIQAALCLLAVGLNLVIGEGRATLPGAMMGSIGVLSGIFLGLWQRRQQSKPVGAITEALARIAEVDPRPELRQLVPELQAIAADRVQQGWRTRLASRVAAQRIDSATADLKDLPRPASAPAPDPAALPRPAGAPRPDLRTLPRVR